MLHNPNIEPVDSTATALNTIQIANEVVGYVDSVITNIPNRVIIPPKKDESNFET